MSAPPDLSLNLERLLSPAATSRLVFLDAARWLAIVLMVFAHVSDSLVSKAEWAGGFAHLYMYTRGTTAPLFLMVAGWAFGVASLPHLADYRRPSRRLASRLSRVLTLCMWGWLLTVPWWHQAFPFGAPESAWVAFASLTPLHCVALSLLVAQGVVAATRRTRVLAAVLLLMGAATIAFSPTVFAATTGWPVPLRGPFNATAYLAGFPLFPWAAFFFLGAGLGFLTREAQWTPRGLSALFGSISVASFAAWLATKGYFTTSLGPAYAYVGPSLVLLRLGAATGILAVAALATARMRRVPSAMLVPSRYGLTFYVGHMAIIWGTPLFGGLHHRVGPTLTFAESGVVTALILAGLWGAVTVAARADKVWVPALVRRVKRLVVRAPLPMPLPAVLAASEEAVVLPAVLAVGVPEARGLAEAPELSPTP